jgi:hypothetical protein
MSIGDVFSKAFDLWKRDVLWLILAAFVVGIIMFAIFLVATLIVVALGGAAFGLSASSDSLTGVSAGVAVLAVIIYLVAVFLVAAVGLAFYGGVFEMVIGAARENRPVRFGDLFSGFRKFGSYLIFALVLAGIGIGLILLFVTLIGIPVAIVLAVWLSVIWLYVLPLIADKDLTFGEAAGTSRAMVKAVGWWKTFGMIVLLEIAIWAVLVIFQLITSPLGNDPESAGYVIRNLVYAVVQAVVVPYAICYISVMYLGSAEATEPAVAGGAAPIGGYALPPAPPAPPQAPPTPTTPVTPPSPVAPETAAAAAVAAGAATAVTAPSEPTGTDVEEVAAETETAADEAPTAADEAPTAAGDAATATDDEAAGPDAPDAPSAPTNPPVPPPLA